MFIIVCLYIRTSIFHAFQSELRKFIISIIIAIYLIQKYLGIEKNYQCHFLDFQSEAASYYQCCQKIHQDFLQAAASKSLPILVEPAIILSTTPICLSNSPLKVTEEYQI